MVRLLLVVMLWAGTVPIADGAQVKARPQGGIGLLLVRTDRPGGGDRQPTLVLYREPGLGRVREMAAAALPRLPSVPESPTGMSTAIVTASRGGWLRIIYDEAEREGWLEPPRSWEYHPWKELLAGRTVALLPGLRKEFYQLRRSPAGEVSRPLGKGEPVRGVRLEGDWLLVRPGVGGEGWLRWRDDNGRMAIAVTVGE
jgi:hypothetical protein